METTKFLIKKCKDCGDWHIWLATTVWEDSLTPLYTDYINIASFDNFWNGIIPLLNMDTIIDFHMGMV